MNNQEINNLVQDHKVLIGMVSSIKESMGTVDDTMLEKLIEFRKCVIEHFQKEDDIIYRPHILSLTHKEEDAQKKEFSAELIRFAMLSKEVSEFLNYLIDNFSASLIKENAAKLETFFIILGKRITFEEKILYPNM